MKYLVENNSTFNGVFLYQFNFYVFRKDFEKGSNFKLVADFVYPQFEWANGVIRGCCAVVKTAVTQVSRDPLFRSSVSIFLVHVCLRYYKSLPDFLPWSNITYLIPSVHFPLSNSICCSVSENELRRMRIPGYSFSCSFFFSFTSCSRPSFILPLGRLLFGIEYHDECCIDKSSVRNQY